MGSEYIWLAPGFVKEVLEAYESWDGKDSMPTKVRELMMVLQIEVNRRYQAGVYERVAAMPKLPRLMDVRLDDQTS